MTSWQRFPKFKASPQQLAILVCVCSLATAEISCVQGSLSLTCTCTMATAVLPTLSQSFRSSLSLWWLQITDLQLKEFFQSFGEVKDTRVVTDRKGLSKGWGLRVHTGGHLVCLLTNIWDCGHYTKQILHRDLQSISMFSVFLQQIWFCHLWNRRGSRQSQR